MLSSFAYLLAFACAVLAIPAPDVLTNAQRLARNLPPLPPKFGRALPGHARDVSGPTPADSAQRSSTSSTPISYSGRIEVRHGHSVLGVLENTSGSAFGGRVNLGGGTSLDLHVTIQAISSAGPFDIAGVQPKWTGSPFLGGGTTHPHPELKAGSAGKVELTSVNQTPRNSPPVPAGGGLIGESKIWSINPNTKEIKAHWVNPDGTKPKTVVAFDAKANSLFLVGDIHASQPESEVHLFLVQ